MRGLGLELIDFRLNVQTNNCVMVSCLNGSVCDLLHLKTYQIFLRNRESSTSSKSDSGAVFVAVRRSLQANLLLQFDIEDI